MKMQSYFLILQLDVLLFIMTEMELLKETDDEAAMQFLLNVITMHSYQEQQRWFTLK